MSMPGGGSPHWLGVIGRPVPDWICPCNREVFSPRAGRGWRPSRTIRGWTSPITSGVCKHCRQRFNSSSRPISAPPSVRSSCSRAGTPRARAGSFAVSAGPSTPAASRSIRSRRRTSTSVPSTISSDSGSGCRSRGRSSPSTAHGTAASWSNGSRALRRPRNGTAPIAKSTNSSTCSSIPASGWSSCSCTSPPTSRSAGSASGSSTR